MFLLVTSYDQIKSASNQITQHDQHGQPSICVSGSGSNLELKSTNMQGQLSNMSDISSCLFSLKGVGAGIEIFWDILDSSQITQNIGYI